jgi:hypothetical protein
MSQRDEAASPASQDDRHSLNASDPGRETSNFEDAAEAGSVRSLTKRTASSSKPKPTEETTVDNDAVSRSSTPNGVQKEIVDADLTEKPIALPTESEQPETRSKSSSVSNRISSTNLDNVSLDDDVVVQPVEGTYSISA